MPSGGASGEILLDEPAAPATPLALSAFSLGAFLRDGFSRTARSLGANEAGSNPKPNAMFAHASTSRHWKSRNHGRPVNNTTAAPAPTASAPSGLITPLWDANAFNNAWPRWSRSVAKAKEWKTAASSVQLAKSTQKKPSHRRIVPGPRRPPPLGRTDLTMRQRRGMNQTAEIPNQPKTTVCMQGTRNDVSDVSSEPRLGKMLEPKIKPYRRV